MTVAFVHNDDLAGFDYGPGHPLRIERLRLCTALMREYGLLDHPRLMAVEAQPAPREALLTFHHPDYLDVLEKADDGRMPENGAAFGLGVNDNPVFPGMWRWSRLLAGSSLMAARVVADGVVPTAFSISGGMHHAQHVTASGFCYINDIVVAINHLLSRGRRVAYVDIDVHHGDGVQDAYYHTDQVLTVSLHQHPRTLFPHTGSFEEMGYGLGRGFSVNLPLWPYTDDDVFVWSFDQIVPPLLRAYRPDVLVTQMGVDTLSDDPLADLQLTDSALMHACRVFAGMGLPWVILGGGGYHIVNPARVWTQILSFLLGVELPEELPAGFLGMISGHDPERRLLRDERLQILGPARTKAEMEARRAVAAIKDDIFPLHGL